MIVPLPPPLPWQDRGRQFGQRSPRQRMIITVFTLSIGWSCRCCARAMCNHVHDVQASVRDVHCTNPCTITESGRCGRWRASVRG
ncbi:UNVERIFIED_ORG: hypothetical protein CLV66_103296 [Actinomadura viridilutea]